MLKKEIMVLATIFFAVIMIGLGYAEDMQNKSDSFNETLLYAYYDVRDNDNYYSALNLINTVTTTTNCSRLLGSSQHSELFSVDINTGSANLIGNMPSGLATEIEYDNLLHTLYAEENNGGMELHTIDVTSGASLGAVIHPYGALTGLEFVGETLYGTFISSSLNFSDLVIVDTSTGILTTVGPTGLRPITGLAYDQWSGTMYGSTAGSITGSSDLVTINLATGSATVIGPTGFNRVGSIEFGPDGNLYGGISQNGNLFPNYLIQIDVNTGVAVPIGDTGFSITGLTSCADMVVEKDYRFIDVCFEEDNDMDGDFTDDPVDFDAAGVPIDNDGDGLFNEDDTECPDGTNLGTLLPTTDQPDGVERFMVEAVLKKNGTVSTYNPGQYYAVSTIEILSSIDELTIWEDYSDCVDKNLSALNPLKGGGSVVIVMVGPDGVARQIMDAKSPNVTLVDGEAEAVIDGYDYIPAGTTFLMYVKFKPGLKPKGPYYQANLFKIKQKGQTIPPFPLNVCENENAAEAQIGDITVSDSATAELIVQPKPTGPYYQANLFNIEKNNFYKIIYVKLIGWIDKLLSLGS